VTATRGAILIDAPSFDRAMTRLIVTIMYLARQS
jgi:hypothetical protein